MRKEWRGKRRGEQAIKFMTQTATSSVGDGGGRGNGGWGGGGISFLQEDGSDQYCVSRW